MMIEQGIFSLPAKAWTAVVVYTVFLYGTLTLAFDIYVWVFDRWGEAFVSRVMNGLFLPVGVALLIFVVFFLPRRGGAYLTFLLICLAMLYCLNTIEVPAKRFHFLQYGPLTVLVFDAVRFRSGNRYLYAWTFAVVVLIGFGDEIIQSLLPRRHFGLQDIVINSTAGLLTLAFIGFVVGEENYPWGSKSSKFEVRSSKFRRDK